MNTKIGVYISCACVLLSLIMVLFQLLTPISITSGLIVLFANITLLLINISKYKKEGRSAVDGKSKN